MLDFISFAQILVSVIVSLSVAVGWCCFFYRKERRLYKNIKRSIGIFPTESIDMKHEKNLLDRTKLFDVHMAATDVRAKDCITDHRLAIIGYSPESDMFREVFCDAKKEKIPVIVYSKPGRIDKEDMELIQGYSNQSMCNTPLRLISDVFAIMSTYPEDK